MLLEPTSIAASRNSAAAAREGSGNAGCERRRAGLGGGLRRRLRMSHLQDGVRWTTQVRNAAAALSPIVIPMGAVCLPPVIQELAFPQARSRSALSPGYVGEG